MKKNNLIRFVQSLVILPVMTMSFSLPPAHNATIAQNVNTGADLHAQTLKVQAQAIDAYFEARHMPLEGLGMKMVLEAERNDIDWRLLPAIAIRESTGGKKACRKVDHNFFGWGSCKISFNSDEEAIETVAMNLGGNNPNTEHHYSGKTTKEILKKYNPPYIVPRYAQQVIAIMNKIGEETPETVKELAKVNT